MGNFLKWRYSLEYSFGKKMLSLLTQQALNVESELRMAMVIHLQVTLFPCSMSLALIHQCVRKVYNVKIIFYRHQRRWGSLLIWMSGLVNAESFITRKHGHERNDKIKLIKGCYDSLARKLIHLQQHGTVLNTQVSSTVKHIPQNHD